MINKKYFLLLILILTSTLIYASNKKLKKTDITIYKNDKSETTLKVEIAKSEEERNYGFMNRKNIPDGTGMIFIFDRDQTLSFWMKNTPHPLSIAYIDSKGVIRDIFDMTPYSLSPIISTVSVRYALEVPQGWYSKNNIKEGDQISLNFLN